MAIDRARLNVERRSSMYNRVILAEKPDMGENIAKALGISSKKRGYILLQNGDVVTWAIGHLIRLKTPDAYERYKEWAWGNLPVIPEQMQTEVDPGKLEQFNIVKELLDNSKECVLATDPDREGEYIGKLILEQCGYRKKWKRLWIDDLTEPTIRKGMENLRDSDEFTLLGKAAQARSYADYWLGFTASRFFTLVAREATGERVSLSAGRVQTPTLRIVYDREQSMENFVAQPFYNLSVHFQTTKGNYKGHWYHTIDETTINRFDDQSKAEAMKKKVSGQAGIVKSYISKEVNRQAPQLLNSPALKTAARKLIGFSTVKTVETLQSLYDKGYVSYPRADSRHLSDNKADELAKHLQTIQFGSTYTQLFPATIVGLKGKSRFVDNVKAATHHAIVPTDKNPALFTQNPKERLLDDEEKLYEMILRHTLAAHHPEGTDRETEIITVISGETFISRSIEVKIPGWRALLKAESEESKEESKDSKSSDKLPVLENGLSAKAISADLMKGQTTKPKRLNDDELENLMKYAGRLVDQDIDDEVFEKLKEKGIGTPATRTNIVQSIVNREYIEIKKNLVYLTNKGRSFMQMVYEHPLASIELTGEFEKKLGEVEQGVRTLESLLVEFRQFTHDILDTKEALLTRIKSLPQNGHQFENIEEIGSCPKCGKPVLEQTKLYSCSGRSQGCDFTIWKDYRGVSIKKKQAHDLITGKEILLKNIPGKEDKPSYEIYIILNNGALETRKPSADDNSLGGCPTCGKPVVEGSKAFGCSAWREGCTFTIWKSFRKIDLTAKIIKPLLAGKEVLIKDLPSEKGPFELYVTLKNGKLDTRTPTAADHSVGACPLCKKPVVETDKSYSCSAWREGCKFRLSKDFLGQRILVIQIKKLLKNGNTDKLVGFTGSKGPFDTALGYDKVNNRYSFVK
jgi:DNA topoisomerase-3